MQKGDLYFLNKYQQHIYYADKNDPYDKYFLVVEGKLVDKFLEAHDITESVIVVHKDVADVSARRSGRFPPRTKRATKRITR